MKKTSLIATIIPAALLLTGCYTTGLSAREQNNAYASMINGVYRQPPSSATNKPLTLPVQLAVAQIGEVAPDASLVAALGANPSLIGDVIALPMPGEGAGNYGYNPSAGRPNAVNLLAAQVESARYLARDSGAQYLLLVGGSLDSYNKQNALAVLDLTIVGGFIVPGTQVRMQAKAAGALIDVESGRVLFMANAVLEQSGLTPDFFTDQKRDEMSAEVRGELLTKLAGNVLDKLNRTASQPAAH